MGWQGVAWIDLAWDGDGRLVPVNAVMNLHVP